MVVKIQNWNKKVLYQAIVKTYQWCEITNKEEKEQLSLENMKHIGYQFIFYSISYTYYFKTELALNYIMTHL